MSQKGCKFEELRYKTGCHYTNERNKQIILYLLKKYGIKRVVVSPGATNFALVGSMQHDPYFEMYSCVDERAAAYMAIGMAEKTGEPVVLSCTGATASRNYMAALTYAYKQNIPILVVTSSLSMASVGHLKAQVTDRDHAPVDVVFRSYQFDNIKDGEDEWNVSVKCNEAISQLLYYKKPIHINVCTNYSLDFSVKQLPSTRYIPTYTETSTLPQLLTGNICVFIGSHPRFSKEQTEALDRFCERNNAVVMCDHTSGYDGRFKVNMALPLSQDFYRSKNRDVDLLIHIGEISGDYYTFGGLAPKKVWRVNLDGEYRDFFKKLSAVFRMDEMDFFKHYSNSSPVPSEYYRKCAAESKEFSSKRPEVPFSNIWIAYQIHDRLPVGSQIQFGILNSLRSWDFFDLPKGVESNANVGGFGIDGCVSSLIGAAMASPDKLFIGVVGDLTFYYDANILLNKNLPNNFRLIVINNGRGIEFRNYCHPATEALGDGVDPYVAAAGHFGAQHNSALKELCNNANIEYCCASSKDSFKKIINDITYNQINKSLIIECLTTVEDESNALLQYKQIAKDSNWILQTIKKKVKSTIGKVVKL